MRARAKVPIVPALVGATLLMSACATQAQVADVIYHGGTILTMNDETPTYAGAVAVKDGKILFVGSKAEALRRRGETTQVRDLGGKAMLPGFIDAHSHFMVALGLNNQVNVANPPVGPATSIASTIKAIEDYQAQAKVEPGGWIVGWGYDKEGLSDANGRNITKHDLDPHFPDHKVVLIHVSAHGAVLNSKALEAADINANTPDPGGYIERLPNSDEPAGLVMETVYFGRVLGALPKPTEDERLKLMEPTQMGYAREGYTHAQEGCTAVGDIDFLLKAADEGKIFLDIASLPSFADMPEWINNPKYEFGKYRKGLKLQGVKFIQDGSPQGKTAYVSEPYLTDGPNGEKDWRGKPTQEEEVFQQQVKQAFDAGLQVFIHANGDAAIDQVIKAVEKAGITAAKDRRTVVIHSQLQRPDHLDEYVRLGISPSYFTNHTYFWGDVHVRNFGPARAAFISPVKAAKAKGIVFSNHTDFNVTPLDPFFVIWTAMARESRTGQVIGPEQRVDAYTALQGLTTGAAWQLFEENRKGKIKEGLLADFVILSADPVKTDVDKICDIKVLETIKKGKTIYTAQTIYPAGTPPANDASH